MTRRCIRVAVSPADGAQLLGDSVWTLRIGESRLGSPNDTERLHVELKLRKHADYIVKRRCDRAMSRRRHAEGGRRRALLEHVARHEPRTLSSHARLRPALPSFNRRSRLASKFSELHCGAGPPAGPRTRGAESPSGAVCVRSTSESRSNRYS